MAKMVLIMVTIVNKMHIYDDIILMVKIHDIYEEEHLAYKGAAAPSNQPTFILVMLGMTLCNLPHYTN